MEETHSVFRIFIVLISMGIFQVWNEVNCLHSFFMDKHLENGVFDKYFWDKLLGTEQVDSEQDQIYCKKK